MKSPGKSTVESQKSNAKLLQEESKIKLLTGKGDKDSPSRSDRTLDLP